MQNQTNDLWNMTRADGDCLTCDLMGVKLFSFNRLFDKIN